MKVLFLITRHNFIKVSLKKLHQIVLFSFQGPLSGFLGVVRTFISAFIASYEPSPQVFLCILHLSRYLVCFVILWKDLCFIVINYVVNCDLHFSIGITKLQTEDNSFAKVLNILCQIYHGEVRLLKVLAIVWIHAYTHDVHNICLFVCCTFQEPLSMQFWDKGSFIDGPIRSVLFTLEKEYPFHIYEFLRFLSAVCEGTWPAECVYVSVFSSLCSFLLTTLLLFVHFSSSFSFEGEKWWLTKTVNQIPESN